MTRSTSLHLVVLALAVSVGSASGQDRVPVRTAVAVEVPNTRQAVTDVVIRDGRLGLIGADRTRVWYAPTVILRSETGITIVVRDGRITELSGPSSSFRGPVADTDASGPIDPCVRPCEESAYKAGAGIAVGRVIVRSLVVARDGSVHAIGGPVDYQSRTHVYSYAIPDGTYTGTVGTKSIVIDWQNSRPARFLLPGESQGLHEVNDQPVPVTAPIRR